MEGDQPVEGVVPEEGGDHHILEGHRHILEGHHRIRAVGVVDHNQVGVELDHTAVAGVAGHMQGN